MKILILFAYNKRHKISRLSAMAITRFIKAAPKNWHCNVVVVYSEQESIDICKKHEFDSVYEKNSPLGAKFNRGLKHALENHDFDYLMIMGDDDIISNNAWQYINEMVSKKEDYFGFRDIFFCDYRTKNVLYFNYETRYTDIPKIVGCGRFISRKALEISAKGCDIYPDRGYTKGGYNFQARKFYTVTEFEAHYLKGLKVIKTYKGPYTRLWDNTIERGLDNDSELRLIRHGFYPSVIAAPCMLVDVKSGDNIWQMSSYVSISSPVTFSKVQEILSKEELEYLYHINKNHGN